MTDQATALRAAAELLEVAAVGDEGPSREATVDRLVQHARSAAYAGDLALHALRSGWNRRNALHDASVDREAEIVDAIRLLGIALPTGRPWTPARRDGTRTTVTVKRCCNGCGEPVGDVTEEELDCAVTGQPLPDVRALCGCIRSGTTWPVAG